MLDRGYIELPVVKLASAGSWKQRRIFRNNVVMCWRRSAAARLV